MQHKLRILSLIAAIGMLGLLAIRIIAPQMAAPMPPALPLTPADAQYEIITPESVKDLQEVRFIQHKDPVLKNPFNWILPPHYDLVYSPDARLIAAASTTGELSIWEAKTGKRIHTLTSISGVVGTFEFSVDGHWLAVSSSNTGDVFLDVWDLQTWSLAWTTQKPRGYDAQFSRRGWIAERLFTEPYDKEATYRVWNLATQESHTIGTKDFSIKFSPDGRFFTDGLQIWDLTTWDIVQTLKDTGANRVIFSPDGLYFMAAQDQTVMGSMGPKFRGSLQETLTGKVMVPQIEEMAELPAFSPNSQIMVVFSPRDATRDTQIMPAPVLWDVTTGQPRHEQDGLVGNISFDVSNRLVIDAMQDTLRVWDVQTNALLFTYFHPETTILAVSVSPDGRTIAYGSYDGIHILAVVRHAIQECALRPVAANAAEAGLNALNPSNIAQVRLIQHFDSPVSFYTVRQVLYTPDGRSITGVDRQSWQTWNLETGYLQRSSFDLAGRNSVTYSSDGAFLALSDGDTLQIWDTAANQLIHTLDAPSDRVVYSPDGRFLAAFYNTSRAIRANVYRGESELRVYDTSTWSFDTPIYTGPLSPVTDFAFSPDSQWLAYVTTHGLTLWSTEQHTTNREFLQSGAFHDQDFYKLIDRLDFTPEGSLLTFASNGEMSLWSVRGAGALIQTVTLPDYQHYLGMRAYGMGKQMIFYRDTSGDLRIWDNVQGTVIHTLKLADNHNAFLSLSFRADGQAFATSGARFKDFPGEIQYDFGTMYVWGLCNP